MKKTKGGKGKARKVRLKEPEEIRDDLVFKILDKNLVDKIEDVLKELSPSTARRGMSKRGELPSLLRDPEVVLRRITEDLEYQKVIAERIINDSVAKPVRTRFKGYHWEVRKVTLPRYHYLEISLVVKPEKGEFGNVHFPITVFRDRKGLFNYWGILHIDDALDAIKQLVEVN